MEEKERIEFSDIDISSQYECRIYYILYIDVFTVLLFYF